VAQPFVTGPAHLFVGIAYQAYQAYLQLQNQIQRLQTTQNTNTLTLDNGTQGSSGTISGYCTVSPPLNSAPPQPNAVQAPPTLTAILLLQNRLPVYLGSAEETPTINIERSFRPWYDDEMGNTNPADDLYDGDSAVVSADVNRWNEPVYAFIASLVNRAPLGGVRGLNLAQEIGTSMTMEGFSYPLWVQFPFAAKPAMAQGGLPFCYRFFNAHLTNDRLEPLNNEPRKTRLIWQCRRILDVVSGVAALYDHDQFNPPLPTAN
jgi:hypothetical protein